MNQIIQEFFGGIKAGAKPSHQNITLRCLPAATESEEDFLTLNEALDKGVLAISEVNEGGAVPELEVSNKSNQKVF
jgi:hypothetical protein